MRRNVLAGLVACGLGASWPGAIFGAVEVPSRTTIRSAERSDLGQTVEVWDGMRGPMTMPREAAEIDLWRCGLVGAESSR